MKPVRQKAVRLLQLKPGDRVLDVGCGMGGSFPFLQGAVGATGEVVGVEISPEVTINARRRIDKNNWRNVQVIEAAAQTAELTGSFDGLLMFAAPDVFASSAALENILPHLKHGARIAFFGAKTSTAGPGTVLNPLLRFAVSRLSFPTTPSLAAEPWQVVAPFVEGLEIERYFFDSMFLACGTYAVGRNASTPCGSG
jgi:SAM-dependent methyltransferase